MSTHYSERCQFGVVHSQCRCPSLLKTVKRIECPTPELHGEAAVCDEPQYPNCYICNDDNGHGGHKGRPCPTGILREQADAIRAKRMEARG